MRTIRQLGIGFIALSQSIYIKCNHKVRNKETELREKLGKLNKMDF